MKRKWTKRARERQEVPGKWRDRWERRRIWQKETAGEKEWNGRGARPVCPLTPVLQASWPCFCPVAWLHLLEGLPGLSFSRPVFTWCPLLSYSAAVACCSSWWMLPKACESPMFSSLSAHLLHAFLTLGSLWLRILCAALWAQSVVAS